MKGSQLVIKALLKSGVRYVFGYTGGAIMPIFDEIAKSSSIELIMPRNEQGGAFMAQGLSRASVSSSSPQIGVCMATSGPGAMNLVTGIADAYMDSVPLIAVTGQVAKDVIATDAFQESDVVGVMMPITKQTYMPLEPEDIETAIHEAIFLATTGRGGPIVIDIPKDVQNQETKKKYRFDPKPKEIELPGACYCYSPDRESIKKATRMINKCLRPIILLGHGAIAGCAGELIRQFATKANIPIAFTLHGLSSIPIDHPLSLGMVGMHGTVEANRAMANADLIISLGMRFDDRVTGKLDTYAQNSQVIHVEIDPSEIDKNVKSTLAINADIREAVNVLLNDPELISRPRRRWFNQIEEYRREIGTEIEKEIEKGLGKEGRLLMKTIVTRLSEITEGKDLIVSDVGQHQMMAARFYNYQTHNSWFTSGGAGTMGASLPMSIGVKLARPEERVWSISGDGGFQMNIQELGTIMEHQFDIKILLLNNGYLGMVRQWQTLFFDGRYAGTPMQNPDYGSIAKGYGIPYQWVTKLDKVVSALEKAKNSSGPYMVEFDCDPTEIILPMVPAGGGASDMIVSVSDK